MHDVKPIDKIWDIQEKLGKIKSFVVNYDIPGVSAEKGKNLVLKGYSAKQDGTSRTAKQSPYFKCTACHNQEKELDNLTDYSAEKKLEFAIKNNLPFLQGTTFYGIVNRKTYYNDDYQKKYGHVPIIKASNTDLRSAIQLCATQCAQGRSLEDWEIESILAYFWSLEYSINDIILSSEEKEKINNALNNKVDKSQALAILESKYMDHAPAHFLEDKPFVKLEANELNSKEQFKIGKAIYQKSCLQCHKAKKYSFFHLDESILSFRNLMSRSFSGSMGALHKITRHGTWPLAGKKAYMPLYPAEKLSENQLQSLRIYIENMSKGINLDPS